MSTAKTKKVTATQAGTACSAVREIILSQRLICQFDAAGQLQMKELRAGAIYLEASEIPLAIATDALPDDLITAIVQACAKYLEE